MQGMRLSLSSEAPAKATQVVIGIPSRDEAPTISGVVSVAVEGLRQCGLADDALLVNADNSTADDTSRRFIDAVGSMRHRVIRAAPKGGKGTNVLAIMRTAAEVGAERVILLDADVRTGQPDWITRLLAAVEHPEPTIAAPVYRRNRYEGNTTNHLVGPLLTAVYGAQVQQPIAGDFAFNQPFLVRAMSWPVPQSAHLYGIDIHLIANALHDGMEVRQVPLGQKLHNPGFPKILFGSQQVLDTLFHVFARGAAQTATQFPASYKRSAVDPKAVRPDPGLIAATTAIAVRYLESHQSAICRLYPSLTEAAPAPWGYHLGVELWPEILADAVAALTRGHAVEARDHLVALYLSRVLTYWLEIEHLSVAEIDTLLDFQADAVASALSARRLELDAASPPPQAFTAGYWAEARS
ncbi:family 2 glycosyl transferase [Micromonospora craterilacus]|uniref:Family 2 glycosyl transferase n=1 Tax=Micromonospora craterilacus TaxID=1655439 RepID=A0A2W2EE46_9ACTN|nr:family 2 glycosyl transferase [Micromonospora craterilacus]